MGAFDLFAMTSDTEQMPYAVVEAMAARLPVLATAVGDVATMVGDENRPFIIARDDQRHLVAALARLCGDQALRRRLGTPIAFAWSKVSASLRWPTLFAKS